VSNITIVKELKSDPATHLYPHKFQPRLRRQIRHQQLLQADTMASSYNNDSSSDDDDLFLAQLAAQQHWEFNFERKDRGFIYDKLTDRNFRIHFRMTRQEFAELHKVIITYI
jgi:hypothetical protein